MKRALTALMAAVLVLTMTGCVIVDRHINLVTPTSDGGIYTFDEKTTEFNWSDDLDKIAPLLKGVAAGGII